MSNPSEAFLAPGPRALIAARCNRCNQHVGTFWEDPRGEGFWAPGACHCPPALPAGDKLAALIAHARRHPVTGYGHAPVKIRV